jgi:hypothetical protein
MTTYTTTSDDVTPVISVDTDRVLSEIKPEIYSGFTECVLFRATALLAFSNIMAQAHGPLHLRRSLRPRQLTV